MFEKHGHNDYAVPKLAKNSRESLVVSSFVLYLRPRIVCSLELSRVTKGSIFSERISGYPLENWCEGSGFGLREFAASTEKQDDVKLVYLS
jgi:hypothetical protein